MATMSVALMAFKSEYDINYGGTFAAICVSVLPILRFISRSRSRSKQVLRQAL